MNDENTLADKSRSTIRTNSKRNTKTVQPDYDSAAGDELPEPSESGSVAESIRYSDKYGGVLFDAEKNARKKK